jgi:hypothetical protein
MLLTERAEAVERDFRRYASSAWRHDQRLSAPPAEVISAGKELLWSALKISPETIGDRQFRRIIADLAGT